MRRFVMRLSVVMLGGMVCFGLGEIKGPALASLLSPASAEAAGMVKKKIPPHHPTTKAKHRVKASGSKGKSAHNSAISTKARARTKKPLPGKDKPKHRQVISGRCEPQSLTYARERSGIMRSRTGRENGPITWFASEKRLGKTTDQPSPGSVLILGDNRRHGMPTGHVAFVEKTYPEGSSRYKVIFSHTNYDRKCSLETNIEALYDSNTKTLDIASGAWQPWGRGLRVAGFIQQE